MDEEAQDEVITVYEEWAELTRYPAFMISSFGRIYNYRTKHYLKPYNDGNGRFQVKFWHGDVHCSLYVHRLVAECFLPDFDISYQVLYWDGNKANFHADNLYQDGTIAGRKNA